MPCTNPDTGITVPEGTKACHDDLVYVCTVDGWVNTGAPCGQPELGMLANMPLPHLLISATKRVTRKIAKAKPAAAKAKPAAAKAKPAKEKTGAPTPKSGKRSASSGAAKSRKKSSRKKR